MSNTIKISDSVLCEFSVFLTKTLGLHYPKEKWKDLERGLHLIMKHNENKTAEACLQGLLDTPLSAEFLSFLASYFTIGETYFFRDKNCFSALEQHILPQLLYKHRDYKILRVWSAGCSTGEEIYSLAIMIYKLLGSEFKNWKITLLASDVNIKSLKHIEKGIYSEWSFRGTSKEIKEHYFHKVGTHHYQILPIFRKMVTPVYLNLALDHYPSMENNTNNMDIIFCRNVLMYFLPERAQQCIEQLYDALITGGYLFVGACEYPLLSNLRFKTINYQGIFLYKKTGLASTTKEGDVALTHWLDPQQTSFIHAKEASIEETPVLDVNRTQAPLEAHAVVDMAQHQMSHLSPSSPDAAQAPEQQSIEVRMRSLANQGNLKEALTLINEAINSEKCNANFRYLKALILQETGSWSEARLELKNSIYLDQQFVLAYFSLGNIARKEGKMTEARNYFSIVLNLIKHCSPDEVLFGSEELTASKMAEIVQKGLE